MSPGASCKAYKGDKMSEGFFSLVKMEKMAPVVPRGHCPCKLLSGCHSPKMKVYGEGRENVLLVGEAPGEKEDEVGKPFVGRSGKLLKQALAHQNQYLDKDCWRTNAVCCRPPHNRTPTPQEIQACRPRLIKTIKELKPRAVVLLGATAIHSLLGLYWKRDIGQVGRWRGFSIPCPDLGCYLVPTFHPSFILRDENGKGNAELFFRQDLDLAFQSALRERPKKLEHVVERIHGWRQARSMFKEFLQYPVIRRIAFDYETTGLKPHRKGHRVVCMSVSDRNRTLAFWNTPQIRKTWQRFLKSPVPKVASNMKFEEAWSRAIFKTKVRGWAHDTMLCSHVLDNRQGITSVKFQAFVRYGIGDYSSHIAPYLEGEKQDANSFNRIDQLEGSDELLLYCGWDAFLEAKLAEDQINEMQLEK